jgi:hypothetical protein
MREIAREVSVTPVPPSSYAGDVRWELAQRVAASTLFKKSPRLRQFLLFVAERSVAGHAADISEYEIGWKVFERGPNYNPVDDSIVRSAARQLRAKVKEYFETEGIGESLILEIPKGGYAPVFTEREHMAAPVILPPVAPPADKKLERELQRWRILTAALAAGILAWVAFGMFGIWKNSAIASAAKRGETIASTVLTKDQTTHVVVGDFGLAYASEATQHPLSVAEYANRSYPTLAQGTVVGPPLQRIWDGLTTGTMTSFPEVSIAGAILRLSGEEGKKAVVQHSRQLSAQDFRSANMIVIASPLGCPWIHLLDDKLNFQYRRTYNHSYVGDPEFVNLHPQPGEKATYSADASILRFGMSYAILARVPNLSRTGKILLIYGFQTSGAQAVGEYATDPRAAAELARIFGVRHASELPDFEVLLSSDSMASTPLNVRVVAHRVVK